ncbi:MAG: hypothetical protein J6D03_05930 [Clostridia bacterium]|nr:hypothetical protein [Clostridia bacterium]
MKNLKTRYKTFDELNDDTPSTGSICCYDGIIIYPEDEKEPEWEDQFIEIADCHNKVRLHRATYDTQEDWIDKVAKIKKSIDNYYYHLLEKEAE